MYFQYSAKSSCICAVNVDIIVFSAVTCVIYQQTSLETFRMHHTGPSSPGFGIYVWKSMQVHKQCFNLNLL